MLFTPVVWVFLHDLHFRFSTIQKKWKQMNKKENKYEWKIKYNENKKKNIAKSTAHDKICVRLHAIRCEKQKHHQFGDSI